ncbi:MAG: hypothetical protein U1E56_10070 [Bauldia sp.]|mgnify:CR=1 FL=1
MSKARQALLLILTSATLAAASAAAQTSARYRLGTDVGLPEYLIGTGVSTVTGEDNYGSCLDSTVTEDIDNVVEGTLTVEAAESLESEARARGLAAYLSIAKGLASGSASRVTSESSEVAKSYFYVTATSQGKLRRLKGVPRPSDDVKTLLREHPEHFYAVCGDSFVSSHNQGSRFTALITSDKMSRRDESDFAASMRITAIGGGGAAAASQRLVELNQKYRMSVRIVEAGDTGETPSSLDLPSILDYALKFRIKSAGRLTGTFANLQRYETVPAFVIAGLRPAGSFGSNALIMTDIVNAFGEATRLDELATDAVRSPLDYEKFDTGPLSDGDVRALKDYLVPLRLRAHELKKAADACAYKIRAGLDCGAPVQSNIEVPPAPVNIQKKPDCTTGGAVTRASRIDGSCFTVECDLFSSSNIIAQGGPLFEKCPNMPRGAKVEVRFAGTVGLASGRHFAAVQATLGAHEGVPPKVLRDLGTTTLSETFVGHVGADGNYDAELSIHQCNETGNLGDQSMCMITGSDGRPPVRVTYFRSHN